MWETWVAAPRRRDGHVVANRGCEIELSSDVSCQPPHKAPVCFLFAHPRRSCAPLPPKASPPDPLQNFPPLCTDGALLVFASQNLHRRRLPHPTNVAHFIPYHLYYYRKTSVALITSPACSPQLTLRTAPAPVPAFHPLLRTLTTARQLPDIHYNEQQGTVNTAYRMLRHSHCASCREGAPNNQPETAK